jgi:hypothetical protein
LLRRWFLRERQRAGIWRDLLYGSSEFDVLGVETMSRKARGWGVDGFSGEFYF